VCPSGIWSGVEESSSQNYISNGQHDAFSPGKTRGGIVNICSIYDPPMEEGIALSNGTSSHAPQGKGDQWEFALKQVKNKLTSAKGPFAFLVSSCLWMVGFCPNISTSNPYPYQSHQQGPAPVASMSLSPKMWKDGSCGFLCDVNRVGTAQLISSNPSSLSCKFLSCPAPHYHGI